MRESRLVFVVMQFEQQDESPPIQDFLIWRENAHYAGWSGATLSSTDRRYIPQSAVKNYFASGRIQRILTSLFSGKEIVDAPDADFVLHHYALDMAILLSIGKGRFISYFLKHESLQDLNLPFLSRPLLFPVASDRDIFKDFYDTQWVFCPARLRYNRMLELEPDRILPFVVADKLGMGGSSITYKITLNQEFNDLEPRILEGKDPQSSVFVMKSYRGRHASRLFETERRAFTRLRIGVRPVPNIIGFLGSFVQNHNSYMLFEYMDLGTSEYYMQSVPPPSTFFDLQNLWEALTGIISGLVFLHGSLDGADQEEDLSLMGYLFYTHCFNPH